MGLLGECLLSSYSYTSFANQNLIEKLLPNSVLQPPKPLDRKLFQILHAHFLFVFYCTVLSVNDTLIDQKWCVYRNPES